MPTVRVSTFSAQRLSLLFFATGNHEKTKSDRLQKLA